MLDHDKVMQMLRMMKEIRHDVDGEGEEPKKTFVRDLTDEEINMQNEMQARARLLHEQARRIEMQRDLFWAQLKISTRNLPEGGAFTIDDDKLYHVSEE